MQKVFVKNRIRLGFISSFLVMGVLLLAACQPQASASQATATTAPSGPTATTAAATMAPTNTQAATTAPTATTAASTATTAANTPTAMANTPTTAANTPTAAASTPTAAAASSTPSAATPTGAASTTMTTTAINVSTTNATLGNFLVDANGNTLYIFKNDTPDTSACTGGCLKAWPALAPANGAAPQAGSGVTGTLAVITRSDGTMQVTYNHQPLYYYAADKKPGDTNGQGVGGKWYVVAP